jgi:quinoprotein relay system zinc metallohydrolase 2
VCYVINTHVHPDHVFGNAAFAADAPVYVGHQRLPAAMAARGRSYRHALERDMGEPAAGSEILPPSLTVRDTLDLDLGDRVLQLRAWPTAHTDNDLTVFDPRTGTLWLSDLLFVRRIPVVDGSLKGWLAAIGEMQRLQPKRVIAGHGEAGAAWREALAEQARYLNLLLAEVRQAIRDKKTLQQAVDTVGLGERERWLLFDGFHRRNVTAAYAELEWED